MFLLEFLFTGLPGLIITCLGLATLLIIALVYVGKCEKLERERDGMLDKQALYRCMRTDRWGRIADGVSDIGDGI